jgi:FAD/FMN-containing dehydrogenase
MDDQASSTDILIRRRAFTAALGLLAPAAMVSGPIAAAARRPDSVDLLSLDGRFVKLGERNYESWRQAMPWQMFTAERKPQIIVRPNSAAAVIDAVNYAREHALQIAIKSGGHNVSEAFLRDGGMLLDLGELQGVEIDPENRTAWVEPALWSHGLIEALTPHRLAFPVAHCATVPMGGYLLGGGVGINGDQWGSIACHSILAAEVITAAGEKVLVSPQENADLYWAVRGAGTGFFGVVTRFQLQLYPLPEAIAESAYIFPLTQLDAAVTMMEDIASQQPGETELMILLAHSPFASAETPAEQRKICIARVVAFGHSVEKSQAILQLAANHASAKLAIAKNENQASSIERMGIDSVNSAAGLGFGRYAVDTIWTDQAGVTLNAIAKHFVTAPSAKTHYVVSFKIKPTLRDDAAFSIIGDAFVGAYALWDDAEGDQANFAWLAEAAGLLLPHARGQYINEVDGFRDPETIQRCFSKSSWLQLQALRKKFDPDNLFYSYPGTA